MKILFYVEPHPIRESLTNHGWIASEFIDMLEDEFRNKKHFVENVQIKLLVSRGIHTVIQEKKEQEVYKDFLIGLSREENDYIQENYLKDWDKESISEWQLLMNGEGEVSLFYEKILQRVYINIFDFDVIVYWGTNGAVKNFSKNYNIPAIAMELGCTRKPFFDSLYFDFLGANGRAYTNQIDIEKVQNSYSFDEIRYFLPFSLMNQQRRDGLFNPINSKYSKEIYLNSGKNILIPLQLADDANILQYSKYNSMFQFLNEIVPRLIENGYTCFIKPHPGNVYRQYNKDDHERCAEYCQEFESVFWLDDIDNNRDYPSLLMKMDCIVVINSSVGFESMLLGKLVIALGDSPYNLSHKLPSLDNFISNQIDMVAYNNTIQKITKLLLFNYLHFKDRGFSFVEFIQVIKYNIKLDNLWNTNRERFKEFVLSNQINSLDDYMTFPVKKKKAPITQVATKEIEIEKKSIIVRIKQFLKKIPFLGKVLKKIKKRFF